MSDKVTNYDLKDLHCALIGKDNGVIKHLHEECESLLTSFLQEAKPVFDMVPTDRVAEKLLPSSAINQRPLSTPADGNCFFNAASLVLKGSTTLSETLRILTAIEIGSGDINYFSHPIIETAMSLPCTHHCETHMAMLISDNEVEQTRHDHGDMEALRHLAIKTATDGYWTGVIHFLALANVIGYSVKSLYPRTDFCEPMKLLLNSTIPPSNRCAGHITTMWSTLISDISNQTMFTPNHFVPLILDAAFDSDDDVYNEKTFALLDPVLMSRLEPSASEWETDNNVPLKKLKCTIAQESSESIVLEDEQSHERDNEEAQDEDCLSDLESVSSEASEECNLESSYGDEGDDEDDMKSSADGIINWCEPFKKINKREFSGEKPGPTIKMGEETSEVSLFMSFLGENFLEKVASASNKYMKIYNINSSALTTKDISAYLGLRIVMGVDPKSCVDDYWSTDTCLANRFVSDTMSKNLFKDIHKVLHVDDPGNPTQATALDRVNDLLSHMKMKSKEYFNLHENISVDEAMIKFHGKHSGVVGAPNKPAKRGYKIYTLADGHTGYIWDFEVYMRTAKREQGLTKRVVETLCSDIVGKHHVVYVDKFYTSIPLALSLLKKKIYLCGSFNTSRKQWPAKLKPQSKGCQLKKMKRGEFMCKQSNDGKMLATVWKDSSLVFNLSTCHNSNPATIRRKIRGPQGWQTVSLNATPSIVDYNRYMGGVDRHDHLRANYTIQRPGHKWWRYFVWFLLDVSLVNSYILFKMSNTENVSHKQFRLKVARQLVGGYSFRSHRARQKDVIDLDRTLVEEHSKTVFPGRPRVCRLCSKRKIKTRAGRGKETRDGCFQCQIHLHKDCFWQYHEEICRSVTHNSIRIDASTQTDDKISETAPSPSFSRLPVITTPARLRRSPRKLKSPS